jgi:hypothetical protein
VLIDALLIVTVCEAFCRAQPGFSNSSLVLLLLHIKQLELFENCVLLGYGQTYTTIECVIHNVFQCGRNIGEFELAAFIEGFPFYFSERIWQNPLAMDVQPRKTAVSTYVSESGSIISLSATQSLMVLWFILVMPFGSSICCICLHSANA